MIKEDIKKYIQFCRCLKNKAPKNCYFFKNVYVQNTIFEGKNMIGYHASIRNSYIGYGTFVAHNSIVKNSKIGKYCAVGYESLIGGHPIHKIASIHPAFYSTKAQYGFTYTQKDYYQEYEYADEDNRFSICIGNDVWVTAGSTKIIQGITIGDGAVIMADAVVTKDVPPYAIVGGIPAKVIGYRFEPDEITFLLKLKWWDKGEIWLKKHAEYFKDIKELRKIVELEENGTKA